MGLIPYYKEYKVYLLLQVCTLKRVPPTLQSVYPITKCVPYYKVYTLLQSVYPITKCTPYYKVYTLLQSVPLLPDNMCIRSPNVSLLQDTCI